MTPTPPHSDTEDGRVPDLLPVPGTGCRGNPRAPSLGWANTVPVLFNASFAAGILAMILFLQLIWGYSAVETGLAVALGPVVVPIFAFLGQHLTRLWSQGVVAALGSLSWGAGILLVLASADADPAYLTTVLPGGLLAGTGVGLALSTILSAATAGLPPNRLATGSAIAGMSRQLGFALGAALLIAIWGTPTDPDAVIEGFARGWWLSAGEERPRWSLTVDGSFGGTGADRAMCGRMPAPCRRCSPVRHGRTKTPIRPAGRKPLLS